MRGKLNLDPMQAARGHKPTISEVLAEYLRAEKSRLAPKTYARYADVIGLFTHSLNGYAASSVRAPSRLPGHCTVTATRADGWPGRCWRGFMGCPTGYFFAGVACWEALRWPCPRLRRPCAPLRAAAWL